MRILLPFALALGLCASASSVCAQGHEEALAAFEQLRAEGRAVIRPDGQVEIDGQVVGDVRVVLQALATASSSDEGSAVLRSRAGGGAPPPSTSIGSLAGGETETVELEVRNESREAEHVGGPLYERGMRISAEASVPVSISSASFGGGFELIGRVEAAFGAGFVGHLLTIGGAARSHALYEDDPAGGLVLGTGLRFGVLNSSSFVPFIQARFRMHVWGAPTTDDESEVQFGAEAGVGLAIELTRYVGIELGCNLVMLFPHDVLAQDLELAVAPAVAGTLYL